MSRILKYRESLNKFIKDKSCLSELESNNNIKTKILELTKNSSFIFSILFLTTLNNQNKKNHVTMQGYYTATAVELINTCLYVNDNRDNMIKNDGLEHYLDFKGFLENSVLKSINQNLESIKNQLSSGNVMGVVNNTINLYISTMTIINKQNPTLNQIDKNAHKDVVKWYLKDDKSLVDKFSKLKQITKESMEEYIDRKYTSVCEMALLLGWVMGLGDIKEINKLKKLAKAFAKMYKISEDFKNIEKDIRNAINGSTYNHIINFGLQESYELFMVNKERFIQDAMLFDMYTSTIKEITDEIESNVDYVIDQTSPDIKSSYSNISKKS